MTMPEEQEGVPECLPQINEVVAELNTRSAVMPALKQQNPPRISIQNHQAVPLPGKTNNVVNAIVRTAIR
jgi:hypothetical protein